MKKLATTLALAFIALATNAQDINTLSRDEIRELKTSFVGQEGMSPETLPIATTSEPSLPDYRIS